MKTKKLIIIIAITISAIGALTGYLLFAMNRADYYAQASRETTDTQNKILALEKSVQLWPKTQNILTLTNLYISVGKNDLAEKIMVGRGDPQILNKLGNLYLTENKVKEAENTFAKAKNKKMNADPLKGLILVELKKGDRGVAESYLGQLESVDPDSASCYGSFVHLNDFKTAKNAFSKAKSCNLFGLDKYFAGYNEAQNPLYLRLQAANLYYSQGYLNLAEKDVLAILKEKDNYRDTHILAQKIYEKLGDQTKANGHKQKTLELDPSLSSK